MGDVGEGKGERVGGAVNGLISLNDFEELENVIPNLTSPSSNSDSAPAKPPAAAEKTIVVIGGGFLGTEVSLAMASRARLYNSTRSPSQPRVKVLQIYAERSPLSTYLPEYLSQDVKDRLGRHGVECIEERLVTDLHERGEGEVSLRR